MLNECSTLFSYYIPDKYPDQATTNNVSGVRFIPKWKELHPRTKKLLETGLSGWVLQEERTLKYNSKYSNALIGKMYAYHLFLN